MIRFALSYALRPLSSPREPLGPALPNEYSFELVTVRQGSVDCQGIKIQSRPFNQPDAIPKTLVAFVPAGSLQRITFPHHPRVPQRKTEYRLGELTIVDLNNPRRAKNLSIHTPTPIAAQCVADTTDVCRMLNAAFSASQQRVNQMLGVDDGASDSSPDVKASTFGSIAFQMSSKFVGNFLRELQSSSLVDFDREDEPSWMTRMLSALNDRPAVGEFSHLNIEWGKDFFILGDFGHHAFFLITEVYKVPHTDPEQQYIHQITRHEVRRPPNKLFLFGYTLSGRRVKENEFEVVSVLSNLKSMSADQIDLIAQSMMKRYSYNIAYRNCQHFIFKLFNRMISYLEAEYKKDGDPQKLEDIELLRESALKLQSSFTVKGQLMLSFGDSGGEHIDVPVRRWMKSVSLLPRLILVPLLRVGEMQLNPDGLLTIPGAYPTEPKREVIAHSQATPEKVSIETHREKMSAAIQQIPSLLKSASISGPSQTL